MKLTFNTFLHSLSETLKSRRDSTRQVDETAKDFICKQASHTEAKLRYSRAKFLIFSHDAKSDDQSMTRKKAKLENW